MKKFLPLALLCTALLSSCGTNDNLNASSYSDTISKAQEISVTDNETSDILDTINTKEELEDFITSLEIDKWELYSIPEDAEKKGTFSFSQEETLKLGQDEESRKSSEVCQIYTYKNDPCVTLQLDGVNLSFKITDDAYEYLNGFFE